jgi:cell wall-associated NlpC family hydrolase
MPTPMPKSVLSALRRGLLVPFVVATLLILGLPTAASAHTSTASSTVSQKVSQKAKAAKAAKAAKVRAAQLRAKKVARVLEVAKNQRGDRYRYGASGPSAFDCSGLVYYSTRKAGFKNVPRTSSAQSRYMKRIDRKWMRPGDFVFFHSGGRVYHVGVYAGKNKSGDRVIVHAPYSGSRVKGERIWTNSWFPGTLRKAA